MNIHEKLHSLMITVRLNCKGISDRKYISHEQNWNLLCIYPLQRRVFASGVVDDWLVLSTPGPGPGPTYRYFSSYIMEVCILWFTYEPKSSWPPDIEPSKFPTPIGGCLIYILGKMGWWLEGGREEDDNRGHSYKNETA